MACFCKIFFFFGVKKHNIFIVFVSEIEMRERNRFVRKEKT